MTQKCGYPGCDMPDDPRSWVHERHEVTQADFCDTESCHAFVPQTVPDTSGEDERAFVAALDRLYGSRGSYSAAQADAILRLSALWREALVYARQQKEK